MKNVEQNFLRRKIFGQRRRTKAEKEKEDIIWIRQIFGKRRKGNGGGKCGKYLETTYEEGKFITDKEMKELRSSHTGDLLNSKLENDNIWLAD